MIRFLKIIIIFILLLAVAVIGAFYYAMSERGQEFIISKINEAASAEQNGVRIEGLRGDLFSHVFIDRVIVSDQVGDVVEVNNIELVWNPIRVATRKERVKKLTAAQVILHRLPEAEEAPATQDKGGSAGSPLDMLGFLPELLAVDNITIKSAVAGKEQQLNFVSRAEDKAYYLELKTIKGPATSVSIKMDTSAEELDSHITVNISDLSVIPTGGTPLKGFFKADTNITGTQKKPIIKITSAGDVMAGPDRIQIKSDTLWQEGRIEQRIEAKTMQAGFNADIKIPAKISLQPFDTDISENTKLDGVVKGVIPLDMLNPIIRPMGHKLAGGITTDIKIGGVLGKPEINGTALLRKGDYENAASGVCLRNIEGDVALSAEQVSLRRLSATDGDKGRLSASANVNMEGSGNVSGNIEFAELKLFCGGLASGFIDGRTSASGSFNDMKVKGELRLGPLHVQIPGAGGGEIAEVETIWVKNEKQKQDEEEQATNIALDIKINAPNRIFVSGRGLDAEFEGNLHVTGDAVAPDVVGSLNSVRGSFKFLDRNLSLRKTAILFEGQIPPSPFLDISAGTRVKTTDVSINLTGTINQPQLSLSSTPSLPQDEALALLLFGRDINSISPFQALKLVNAVRVLAGEAEQVDLLAGAREKLGLDTLELEAGEDNQTSISTGKYVTDKVYVGIKQGSTIESKQVVTELELTPSISARTAVDGAGSQSFGIQWKKDY